MKYGRKFRRVNFGDNIIINTKDGVPFCVLEEKEGEARNA